MQQIRELWAAAGAQADAGRWEDAAALYTRITEIVPGHAAALLQLSYVRSAQGRYRDARECALGAAGAGSVPPGLAVELLARLRTFNEAGAFHGCVARLPPMSRIAIPQLIAIGAQLSYNNEQAGALRFIDEAYRGDPEFPPTLAARGQVLTYLGRFDEARKDLERCVSLAPRLAQAWWLLSRLGIDEGRSARIDGIRRVLAAGPARRDDVAVLMFSLHNELDAAGEYGDAWLALEQACAAKRSQLRYSREETEALFDALIGMPVKAVPGASDGAGRRPVFVVGMHRSGTTLLEQLLDRHPDVRGLGELYDFTQQMRFATDHHCRGVVDREIVRRASQVDPASVGRGYLRGLAWRLGDQRWFVDKLPSNFLNLGFIAPALPGASILHMRRDPLETCFSNLRELFSDACPYSYDQGELAHYFRQYRRLMAHWRNVLGDRILDVEYGRLVGDVDNVLQQVTAFCGIDYDPAMREEHGAGRGVATASAVQVRRAVAAPSRPKWTPYAGPLEPLREALAGL